jgi:fumarate reductase (CoM/CoB) subunit A
MKNFERIQTDVLVIGSEGAGARAAIELAIKGKKPLITTKGIMGGSGVTLMAPFSCCVAYGHQDPRDNPDVHFEDAVIGGKFLNNQEMVDVFTKEAPQALLDLESYGAKFEKQEEDPTKFIQASMPGHRYPRAIYYDFSTGLQFRKGLKRESKKRGVAVKEDFFVADILVEDGAVTGALCLDIQTGKFVVVECPAVILATGGNLELYYPYNDGSCDVTGDGSALALRAGAECIDMEFQQFFPTGMVWPPSVTGMIWIGDLRYRLGGFLYNKNGERFMKRYDPERMELSTRDITSRSMVREILEGRGSPHGGVYLDVSHMGNNIVENYVAEVFPNFSFRGYSLIKAGVDIRTDAMEVAPMAHFTMGGVRVNPQCETKIRGLFGAGEVTGGLHGANRCEGNALPETQVFGKISGQVAAEYIESTPPTKPRDSLIEDTYNKIMGFSKKEDGIQHFEIRKKIQKIMWNKVGVVRTLENTEKAVKEFEQIKKEDLPRLFLKNQAKAYNRELFEALETVNMFQVGEAMAKSASLRKESRGAHYLIDLPERDDKKFLVNAITWLEGDELKIRHQPANITKLRPEEVDKKWLDLEEV